MLKEIEEEDLQWQSKKRERVKKLAAEKNERSANAASMAGMVLDTSGAVATDTRRTDDGPRGFY